MELLSRGSKLHWVRTEIGVNQARWENYRVSQRTVMKEYGIESFRQAAIIIAPMDSTFPIVDFVFSLDRSQEESPIVAFQFSWCNKHGVSWKGLCTCGERT